jgi:D-threonate/D-erythronate kinase
MTIRIITDDFTSASDGIAAFADRGWACAVAFAATEAQSAAVVSCDTDSRTLAAPQAVERVAHWAAAWKPAHLLIKQFDSTLRGPVAAEIHAAWHASGRGKLIIAPAFPDAGRTTREGLVYVHGVPVSDTAFAADPLNPVKQSNVQLLLREAGISASVCQPHRLLETLRTTDAVIVDAQTESDLDAIASLHTQTPDALWCGSTGLVRAFARTLPLPAWSGESSRITLPASRHTYVCIGSRNPVSKAQQAFLSEANLAGVTVVSTEDKASDPHLQAEQLAFKVAQAVRSGECDSIIATGGETAKHIAHALQAKRLHVLRELAPGIPLCALELEGRYLPFVTKAGGFGQAHSLRDLTQALRHPYP